MQRKFDQHKQKTAGNLDLQPKDIKRNEDSAKLDNAKGDMTKSDHTEKVASQNDESWW